jgi:hypothetical protein
MKNTTKEFILDYMRKCDTEAMSNKEIALFIADNDNKYTLGTLKNYIGQVKAEYGDALISLQNEARRSEVYEKGECAGASWLDEGCVNKGDCGLEVDLYSRVLGLPVEGMCDFEYCIMDGCCSEDCMDPGDDPYMFEYDFSKILKHNAIDIAWENPNSDVNELASALASLSSNKIENCIQACKAALEYLRLLEMQSLSELERLDDPIELEPVDIPRTPAKAPELCTEVIVLDGYYSDYKYNFEEITNCSATNNPDDQLILIHCMAENVTIYNGPRWGAGAVLASYEHFEEDNMMKAGEAKWSDALSEALYLASSVKNPFTTVTLISDEPDRSSNVTFDVLGEWVQVYTDSLGWNFNLVSSCDTQRALLEKLNFHESNMMNETEYMLTRSSYAEAAAKSLDPKWFTYGRRTAFEA